MLVSLRSSLIWGVALAVLTALPASAAPEDPRASETRRWVPALALTSGVLFQEQESSVEATCDNGGLSGTPGLYGDCGFSGTVGPGPLRPAVDDSGWTPTPYIGANLQLMSPAIPLVPTRPRVFISAGVLAIVAASRDIAKEGDPQGIKLPTTTSGGVKPPSSYTEEGIGGKGSRTTSQFDPLAWTADVGVAIPFKLAGRRILLKPSVGWTQFGMDVDGRVVAAIKDDHLPIGPLPPNFFGANIREVFLTDEDSQRFNAIGPGLEIEMDAGRHGQIAVSLYLGGHGYRVLGDRDIHLSDTQTISGDGQPADTYRANWTFQADKWIYRAGVGLRFHWLGR